LHRQRAGGGDPGKRPAPLEPRATKQEAESPSAHRTTDTRSRNVLGTISAYVLTFAGMAAFLLLIVAAGLLAGLVSGVPGLVLYGGVFVVAVMVMARNEGVI